MSDVRATCQQLGNVLSELSEESRILRELSNLQRCQFSLEGLPILVKELEEQLSLVQMFLNEEESSLNQMEENLSEAHRQNILLSQIVDSLPPPPPPPPSSSPVATTPSSVKINNDEESSAPTKRRCSGNHRTPRSRSSPLKRESIVLERVTTAELEAVPRTARGRISLAMVNEVVEEIKQVCREKYSGRRSRRFDYNKQDLPLMDPWISEHDLRQECAFFQKESTARTALQILRTLGRVRQVPCKRGKVIYCLEQNPETLKFSC